MDLSCNFSQGKSLSSLYPSHCQRTPFQHYFLKVRWAHHNISIYQLPAAKCIKLTVPFSHWSNTGSQRYSEGGSLLLALHCIKSATDFPSHLSSHRPLRRMLMVAVLQTQKLKCKGVEWLTASKLWSRMCALASLLQSQHCSPLVYMCLPGRPQKQQE